MIRAILTRCRRKKVRCSGERPVCEFCARLNQQCSYEDQPTGGSAVSLQVDNLQENNANLAARVALLETRLSLLDPNSVGSAFQPLPPTQPHSDALVNEDVGAHLEILG